MQELDARQQRFVEFYVGNGVEAARAAGYTGNDRTLAATASRLLARDNIKAAMMAKDARAESVKIQEDTKHQIATRSERRGFWTKVMNDVEADMSDRLRASELLGKSVGDFIEKRINVNADERLPKNCTPEQLEKWAAGDDE